MTLLSRKMVVGAQVFTLQAMDKQKDGSAGWLQFTLTKFQVPKHMHAVAAELHSSKPELSRELGQVLSMFSDHAVFDKHFPSDVEEETTKDEEAPVEEASCPLEKAKVGLSKPAAKMVDFFYNTFDGSLDAEYRKLASHATPLMAMQDAKQGAQDKFRRCASIAKRRASGVIQFLWYTWCILFSRCRSPAEFLSHAPSRLALCSIHTAGRELQGWW